MSINLKKANLDFPLYLVGLIVLLAIISIISLVRKSFVVFTASFLLTSVLAMSISGYFKSARYFQIVLLSHIYKNGEDGKISLSDLRKCVSDEGVLINTMWILKAEGMIGISEMDEESGIVQETSIISIVEDKFLISDLYHEVILNQS